MGRLKLVRAAALLFCAAFLSTPAHANETSQWLVRQAHQALESKKYAKAGDLCQQAMVADPKEGAAFACLGRSLAKRKKSKDADRYYKLALARSPEDESALSWAGLHDLNKGRPDKAHTKLKKLEKICGACLSAKNLRAAYKKYKAKKNASR